VGKDKKRTIKIAPGHTTAIVGLPVREIFIAQGIQFNNDQLSKQYYKLPDGIFKDTIGNHIPGFEHEKKNRFDYIKNKIIIINKNTFTYTTSDGKIMYRVNVINKKNEFKEKLARKNVCVIYDGHSRYGRGACFGDNVGQGDWWENGTSDSNGLFRLGFPAIGVEFVDDILERGYKCFPWSTDEKLPPESERHYPEGKGKLITQTKEDLLKELKNPTNEQKKIIEKSFLAGKKYYTYLDPHSRRTILLRAGWKDTKSSEYELGKPDKNRLNCKVFCHFGCSSLIHYHPIIRGSSRYNWKKEGDNKLAYFTDRPSDSMLGPIFLYFLFKSDKTGSEWEPAFEDAKKEANKMYDKLNLNYQIK